MAQHDQPPRRVARTSKPNTFFGGAAILAVGILVVKLIGMFYKIPLLNIIGEQGSADFNNAYNIYSVLLTISTAGLPVAVSKLVSEADALGRRNQVRRTFRLALALFLILGVLSFLVMFFGSEQLAGLMNDSMAAPGIRALAPAVICVGCLSAFRGYAQGHGSMTPTAVSQIIEALCKLTVGLGLAYWLVGHGADASHAAAGAITGVTVGTIVALAYMLMNFLITRSQEPQLADDRPDEPATILKHWSRDSSSGPCWRTRTPGISMGILWTLPPWRTPCPPGRPPCPMGAPSPCPCWTSTRPRPRLCGISSPPSPTCSPHPWSSTPPWRTSAAPCTATTPAP